RRLPSFPTRRSSDLMNAFLPVSAINGSKISQFREKGKKGQTDDGEMVTLNTLEELDALTFDLIGADARQCLVADAGQMPADETRSEEHTSELQSREN